MKTVKVNGDKDHVLVSYMSEVIASLHRNRQFSAVATYTSVLHSVSEFMGDADAPLDILFTQGRLKDYEEWLEVDGYKPNTISTYIRTLQAVYNRWMPTGTPEHNTTLFADVYTQIDSSTKRSITPEQMNTLLNIHFKTLPDEEQVVLGYFLLMFLLRGMPFIDLAHLRKTDLRGDKIIYTRHKTDRQITVEVSPEAMRLIKLLRDRSSSIYLLPILTNEMKRQKKTQPRATDTEASPEAIVGEELYRHYRDALRRFNRALKKLMARLLPGVSVSSYTARHSWATFAYHMGTSVGLISQAMGHASITVTMTYLRAFDNEVIDKINRQVQSYVRKCKWKKK